MPARQRGHFTLIELLVVVGLIIILISMLMPALRTARETTYRIACANNLKQFGVGFQSYSTDYDGWNGGYRLNASGDKINNWRNEIGPYVGGYSGGYSLTPNKIYVCPALRYEAIGWLPQYVNESYLKTSIRPLPRYKDYEPWNATYSYYFYKLQWVKLPSVRVYLVDGKSLGDVINASNT